MFKLDHDREKKELVSNHQSTILKVTKWCKTWKIGKSITFTQCTFWFVSDSPARARWRVHNRWVCCFLSCRIWQALTRCWLSTIFVKVDVLWRSDVNRTVRQVKNMGRRRWRFITIAAFLLFMTKDTQCQGKLTKLTTFSIVHEQIMTSINRIDT